MRKRWTPHPVFLLLLTLLLSAPGGAALCAVYMRRFGRLRAARGFAALAAALVPAIALAVRYIPAKWYYIALALAGFNLAAGSLYLTAVWRGYTEMAAEIAGSGSAPRYRAGAKRVIFGILTGAAAGYPVGFFFAMFYGKLSDSVLSTLLPVNPDIFSHESFLYVMSAAFIPICGAIGGISGGLVQDEGLPAVFRPAAALVIASTILMFLWHLFVDVILFQSYGIAPKPGSGSALPEFVYLVSTLLFGVFSVAGAFFLSASAGLCQWIGRTALAAFFGLMLAATAVVYTGIVSFDFLILGKVMERRGAIPAALEFYEKSLTLYPNHYSASYLQFRIGLLLHERGRDRKALEAFKNVVTKYTGNEDFVRHARLFIDRMKDRRDRGGGRVVIPGVSARTEYRSAYCAPNSMSLIFRHWKKDFSAKRIGTEITYTLFGTSSLDMLYFAEQNGFDYFVSRGAKVDYIRRLVRMNVPVLVFIPHHVFVVFGYDTTLDTLISYDVAEYDVWVEHPVEDFLKEWQQTGREMAVMFPEGMSERYLGRGRSEESADRALGYFSLSAFRGGGGPCRQADASRTRGAACFIHARNPACALQ